MFKNKYKKILIISFILLFAIMAVSTAIFAGDLIHTEHCEVHNCSLCSLINMSTEFVRNMGILNIVLLVLTVSSLITKRIIKQIREFKRTTLVELKIVQLN